METNARRLLEGYFSRHGLLLCNEDRDLPWLDSVGGDWNAVVALIEDRQVFWSKLWRGKVTYLSRACYWQLKPYRQRLSRVPPGSREAYDLLADAGPLSTEELKRLLRFSGREYGKVMDPLFKELLVTAVERERTIADNWSSFRWATCQTWEAGSTPEAPDAEKLRRLLIPPLTERQVQNLTRRGSCP